MAEIVQSLFGVSPEMYQRQQQDRADAQALRFAQLDPFQQANFAIGRGANMLGGAIGGALGGQDPELQRITMRQQIASQIDFTDPASIQQGMNALGDDVMGKQQLAQIYRQQQESGALIAQRTAAATRERAPTGDVAKGMRVNEITRALQTPEISALERIGLEAELNSLSPAKAKEPTTPEITNAAAFAATKGAPGTPAYTAAFQSKHSELIAKTPRAPNIKTVGVAKGTNQPVYFDQDTNEQFTVAAGPDGQPTRKLYVGGVDRTTAKTEVSVGGTAENEYAKVAGKSTAERDINLIESAQSVATTLPKMYETRQLLESGDLNTGIGAEIQQVIDRVRSKFLNDKRAGRVVNDTEYLNALLGSDVFPQISALGIGARGLDTPAEREFLREVITGTISMDRNTLKRMTDFRIRSAERAVEKYNEQLGAGEFKQYQTVTGRTLNPIRTQTPPARQGDGTPSAAPAAPAGNIDALLRKYP
jgi:hypothetical protein